MNEDTVAGKLKSAGGKIKQATGEAIGNQELANSGAADRVKGAAQETWGKTKDAAHDVSTSARVDGAVAREDAHESAHNTREGIAGAAEHLKDSISRGIDNFRADLHHHDEEKLSQVQ
ncbi:CsbD family protein [Granulicella sibirica]|uniref:CsbD-like domain-containing protein n=1 Tax=Granulicella sibirica TaxID=2479048 RepID=A0A4Q0T1H9_9BACT|nr:CsbD family protein [Granulicella sibirica]RXH57017.1 hypothetical protein GRAN_0327 [Granulicella sibirica]